MGIYTSNIFIAISQTSSRTYSPSKEGGGGDVAVSHSCHGNQRPPVGVQHRHEVSSLHVVLKDIHERGEDENPHEEKKEKHPQLSVTVSDCNKDESHIESQSIFTCLSQSLQGPDMSGKLEYSDDAKQFDDSQ